MPKFKERLVKENILWNFSVCGLISTVTILVTFNNVKIVWACYNKQLSIPNIGVYIK